MGDSYYNTSLDSLKLVSLPQIESTSSTTPIVQGEGFRKSREERHRIKEAARLLAEGNGADLEMEAFQFTEEQKFKSMMGLGILLLLVSLI